MSEPTTYEIESAETVTLAANTSAQSSAIGTANSAQPSLRKQVRVVSTVAGYLTKPASDPTAVAEAANTVYLPAGVPEVFDVPLGYKFAFIAASIGKINFAVLTKAVI